MKKSGGRQSFQMHLGGRVIDYTVRQSARAKHIGIRIGPESGVEVVIPGGKRACNIEACLKSREDWILDKLDHYDRLREKKDSRRLAMFLGREYKLVPVIRHEAAPAVKIFDGNIFVTAQDNSPETLAAVLEKWYRTQARAIFEEKVRSLSSKAGLSFSRIYIRGQKTRWGSCSRLGNLNFNWRLVMAPEEVIDYIVVHELSHLKEMNHSGRFWSLVENLCPDYKKHRRWLRENGFSLSL